ncbi:MAG: hypothetical protein OEO23_06240 [Gemmatimonadota bacterium]|nr:hypothetical protein [Gemmatimonadota bacterium]
MQPRLKHLAWAIALTGTVFVSLGTASAVDTPIHVPQAAQVSFAGDVLPIFQNRCVECHGGVDENGEERREALLDLRSYEGLMAGSEFGEVIEPGDAEASYLLEMIVEGDMPDEGDPVPEAEIETIRSWIAAGAENN